MTRMTTRFAAALLLAGTAGGLATMPAASPAHAQSDGQNATTQNTVKPAEAPEISTEERDKIVRLLELTRIDRTVQSIAPMAQRQIDQILAKQAPNMAETERAELVSAVPDTFRAGRDELLTQLVPIYAQVFTSEEIDYMLEFYDTATGQAVADKLPQAIGASRQVSQQWSRAMAQQAFQQVRQDAAELGYEL